MFSSVFILSIGREREREREKSIPRPKFDVVQFIFPLTWNLSWLRTDVLPKVHVIVKDIHTRVPDGADIA